MAIPQIRTHDDDLQAWVGGAQGALSAGGWSAEAVERSEAAVEQLAIAIESWREQVGARNARMSEETKTAEAERAKANRGTAGRSSLTRGRVPSVGADSAMGPALEPKDVPRSLGADGSDHRAGDASAPGFNPPDASTGANSGETWNKRPGDGSETSRIDAENASTVGSTGIHGQYVSPEGPESHLPMGGKAGENAREVSDAGNQRGPGSKPRR